MTPGQPSNSGSPAADRTSLETRLEALIDGDPATISDEHFDHLARDLFDYQVGANPAYANYCREIGGGTIPRPRTWNEIPALPADAFRNREHPPTCFPVADAVATFETSGTTDATTGLHHLSSTRLYKSSILAGWRHASLPELPLAILTPSPADAPRSSLSFMMGTLADHFGPAIPGASPFLLSPDGTIDLTHLRDCAESDQPFLLLGTALAFLHLFERLAGTSLPLPAGSAALETGGYKGTRHSLTKPELYSLFEKHLSLPADRIINEYGMTELSSQFYTTGIDRPHIGGPWTRVSIIDPETGTPAKPGAPGLVTITDLANLDSCIRIATRDLGIQADENGNSPAGSRFTLLGRDPGALARGCSRAADELLSAKQRGGMEGLAD